MDAGLFGNFGGLRFNIPMFMSSFAGACSNWLSNSSIMNYNAFGDSSIMTPGWLMPQNWVQSLKYQNNNSIMCAPYYQPSTAFIGDSVHFNTASFGRTSSKSSSSKTETSEDKAIKNKYNNLKSLLTSYATYYEDNDLKSDINDVVNDKSKSVSDKLEGLQSLRNGISTSDLASYIRSHSSIKIGDTPIKEQLNNIGYEVVHDEVSDLKLSYEQLKDAKVLRTVSAYNTGSANLIEDVLAIKDKTERTKIAQALRNNLVEEAKTQAKNMKTDNKFYETLSNTDVNDSKFAEEFNKVYAYTRILAAKTVSKIINTKYGMDDELFLDKTEKDLKEEKGIKEADITSAKSFELGKNISMKPASSGKITLKGDSEEKLNQLETAGHLKSGAEIDVDGLKYTSYKCEITGEYYILKDGDIHKVAKGTDGKWTDSGKVNPKQEFEDDESALQKALSKIITPEKQAEAEDIILSAHPELEHVCETTIDTDKKRHNVFKVKGTERFFVVFEGKLQELTNVKFADNKICKVDKNKTIERKDAKDDDLEKIVLNKVSTNINQIGSTKIGNTTVNLYAEGTTHKVLFVSEGKIYCLSGANVKRDKDNKITYYFEDEEIGYNFELPENKVTEIREKEFVKEVEKQKKADKKATEYANTISSGSKMNFSVHCRR